jgi:hypothetical protein
VLAQLLEDETELLEEGAELLEELTLDEVLLEELELLREELDEEVALHTAPAMVGFSALPPFLLTWKPNSTV